MEKINADKVMYIKLGRGGDWVEECLSQNNMKLGYYEANHKLCLEGSWDKVKQELIAEKISKKTATTYTNQIRHFYEDDEKTLWITFHANKLWWCFAESKIILNKDLSKQRKVIGNWSDKDIQGNSLHMSNISGKILKTQGFRSTICKIEKENIAYLLNKINSTKSNELKMVIAARAKLVESLIPLIKSLTWQDFEILIDLIFRYAGWQRVSKLGATQKTLDLDLKMPISGRKAAVQIKSQSEKHKFDNYEDEFKYFTDYDEFYYFVHSPKGKLSDKITKSADSKVKLCFAEEIAEYCIAANLVDWLMERSS
ncbi:MAG: hypothetical protein K9M99_12615 [Candidatus Cloacimonetes bacterium]|nr:hypothetical protein [Candidatus Cloacimonadota bacterium]